MKYEQRLERVQHAMFATLTAVAGLALLISVVVKFLRWCYQYAVQ